jgi:hypothetical protein
MGGIPETPPPETENAALPPGKTAFLIMPHHNPHLWNSGKAALHSGNKKSIA